MIGRQYPGGSVDEVAVRRDDELLELLGRRSAPRGADAVGSLLWALILDVDREDVALAPEPGQGDLVGARRRHGARGTVIGVVVAATLSVSGVAAAVTGDPLSPYRAVISLAQDDGPPAARRAPAPARGPVRREAAPTGQDRVTVVVPEILGRASAPSGPASKHRASTPPHGTTRGPDGSDRPAARKDVAEDVAEDVAKDERTAERKARHLPRATPEHAPARSEDAAPPPPRRPETKEERDKP